MAQAKKTGKRSGAKKKQVTLLQKAKVWLAAVAKRTSERRKNFLARRPHRSFRRTRRRDYVRSLKLPNYLAFTSYVNSVLRRHWRLFGLLILTYALIMIALGAITSQDTYATINELLRGSTNDFFGEGIGRVGQAGVVFVSAFVASGNALAADQQVYVGISLLFAWLATVWLLREILAGRKPNLRDGLYNSGAPVLATLGVLVVLTLQLLPVAIVMLLYAGLSTTGMVDTGFGAMLFWVFAAMVGALVLYWITSTILALVVVTLPGMYPLRAVKIAGDLVVSRRLRILLRLLWGVCCALLSWAVVLIVVILITNAIGLVWPGLEGVPIVPYVGSLVSSYAVVWFAAYTYLFYRKVVDDDAKPA